MPQTPFRVTLENAVLHFDRGELAARITALPPNAPIAVLIHGYRFSPDAGQHCPYGHIFALNPAHNNDRTAVSWPRHLGLTAQSGLVIAFGWQARGFLPFAARRALAELAGYIRATDPNRRIDIIAHSLGARVALAALHHGKRGDFRRMILLAAAETRRPALAAMATAAGRATDVINVTSRENDLFDFLYEWGAKAGLDTAIGQGLNRALPNWLNLQLDQPATLASLARLGFPLPQRPARICHWSPYIRPGIFALYRALLDDDVPLPALARALPKTQTRRWQRLIQNLA